MKNTINKLTISAILDYVIEINGAHDYQQNELFELKNNSKAQLLLISASDNKAYCLASGNIEEFSIGEEVVPAKSINSIITSEKFFGKIIDIRNQIIFPRNVDYITYYDNSSEIFNKPNDLLDYEPLNEQLNTGYIMVDLLVPIGKGQRELIIGNRKTGKTHIALNTIINQKGKNMKCIYVAIGQQHSHVANVYQTLKANDALDYTMIIEAKSDNPFDQYLAPYVAMAHAENISHHDDVLIVFDDLTKHANVFREIALLTNKPVGKEAFPGDMFYAHSRLLERSGKFKGRKSITALPILQIVDNDITSLIASNVISITDGQLVTNEDLFAINQLPAVDLEYSVSRIGGNVQSSHVAKVASEIGKIYHAYKRQTKLSSMKYDLNDDTKALINKGQMVQNMFIQRGIASYSQKTMFLMTKLIAWNLIDDSVLMPNILKFFEILLETNQDALKQFEQVLNNQTKDEQIARDYFAFVLQQFANKYNLNWKVNSKNEFIPLNEEELEKIATLMEVK